MGQLAAACLGDDFIGGVDADILGALLVHATI